MRACSRSLTDFSWPGDPLLCQHHPLLRLAGPVTQEPAAGQQKEPEEPHLAPDIPGPATDIPSDPSFRLPEGVDPLSAVLLEKAGQAPPSEDYSASEDGGEAGGGAGAAAGAEGAAGSTSAAAPPAAPLPPLPPAEPPAAAAKGGAASGTIASPGEKPAPPLPGLAPPPWATPGAYCYHLSRVRKECQTVQS